MVWRVGRGREPWERSEAGGVNDDERHLRHSPVSSPTEELRKDKRRSDDSGRRERPGLDFSLCLCAAVVREGLPLYFCVCLFLLNLFKCSPVPASFYPFYELCYRWLSWCECISSCMNTMNQQVRRWDLHLCIYSPDVWQQLLTRGER